jgi:hypothetical protein
VAQGEVPEFKPQYCKRKKRNPYIFWPLVSWKYISTETFLHFKDRSGTKVSW